MLLLFKFDQSNEMLSNGIFFFFFCHIFLSTSIALYLERWWEILKNTRNLPYVISWNRIHSMRGDRVSPDGKMTVILSTRHLLPGGNVIPCPPSPHESWNHEVYIEGATFVQIPTPWALIFGPGWGPDSSRANNSTSSTWLQMTGLGEATWVSHHPPSKQTLSKYWDCVITSSPMLRAVRHNTDLLITMVSLHAEKKKKGGQRSSLQERMQETPKKKKKHNERASDVLVLLLVLPLSQISTIWSANLP